MDPYHTRHFLGPRLKIETIPCTYIPVLHLPLSVLCIQNGWAAIHLAARSGFLHVVRELVEVCHADYKCAKPVSSSQHHMLFHPCNCPMHISVFHLQLSLSHSVLDICSHVMRTQY